MKMKYLLIFFIFFYSTSETISQTCIINQLDLVLALDSSSIVGASNFELIKNSIIHMIYTLNIGSSNVRVGIVGFSSMKISSFLFFKNICFN